jgi:SAM-dependent methyltransferase
VSAPALAPFGTELLDDPNADPEIVARSLGQIARANRWFGGRAAALRGIERMLDALPRGQAATLLDIGTGAGDLPVAAIRRAHRAGRALNAIGLERSPVAAALAAARRLPVVLGCAGRLPVRPRGADVVLISQVAHHLAPAAAVELFRDASAIARVGVVVADLRRSELAVAAFRVGSTLLRFDAVTRDDGITSVRRGYSVEELRELIRRAGFDAGVERRPGFRLLATWRTG